MDRVAESPMTRIDVYPTHTINEFPVRIGRAFPFGASFVPGGVNFSIFSRHATSCTLILFEKDAPQPFTEIEFPKEFRIGNVFTMIVFGLDYETIEYGYRMDGPRDATGFHRFDPSKILLDPYAKVISGRDEWGKQPDWNNIYQHRARLVYDDFDWEWDHPLELPITDLVIYEMHVRSFTRHPSSGAKYPGTFAAIREKIPYLKSLGVNCVELLPIFEFDEFENSRDSPVTGERLYQYWGYSQVGFFAPKAGFAATGKFGMQVDELKTTIKALHAAGIEVLLDVVFNHTAEGNEYGPTISYRGVDNDTYYMLTPDGYYYNFSGCGNTLNCNNPLVRTMILDCLRYWAEEYHIDGFRFDLASILSRDENGAPLANPPLLETLAFDPVLAKCKLIAEAWDAGGLYQVGSFPAHRRWAEWNGKYRDDMRKFLKGEGGLVSTVATRLIGSPDLYAREMRGASASINFFNAHDGFVLYDLVAYNGKHNEANGWDNTDGGNDNESWNCGWEGPTDNPEINALRQRQMRNAFAMLLISQGVPMFVSGDEVARTQNGNNNTYCQDNDLNWFDWSLVEKNAEQLKFVQNMIAFRKAHPALRNPYFLSDSAISWHSTQAWQADWSEGARTLAFMLNGSAAETAQGDDDIYVALNMYWETETFGLPQAPSGKKWHVAANTCAPDGNYSWTPGSEPLLDEQNYFILSPRSVSTLR